MRLISELVEDGPLGLLLGCHRRAERFSELACRLADPGAPRAAVVDAAAAVHRYFTVAFPLHEEDEEQSLVPRLLTRELSRGAQGVIRSLESEHQQLNGMLAGLRPAWLGLGATPSPEEELPGLLERTLAFRGLLLRHAALEEAELFPEAQRVLGAREMEEFYEEMRERRAARA